MLPRGNTAAQPITKNLWAIFATKTAIFVLLFTVAGLATLAKNGQYYPTSNPARNVSISTKMNVSHSPVHVAGEQMQTVTFLFPLLPPLRAARALYAEALQKPPIGVIVSTQYRSPPAQLS
jgi:hypothetical protein